MENRFPRSDKNELTPFQNVELSAIVPPTRTGFLPIRYGIRKINPPKYASLESMVWEDFS